MIFDIELNISYISRNPEIVRPPIPPMDKAFESEEEFIKNIVDPNYNPDISEPTRVRNIHKIYQQKN